MCSITLDDYIIDHGLTYKIILTEQWKESTTTDSKIVYILRLGNEFTDTRSDGYWELASIKETV